MKTRKKRRKTKLKKKQFLEGELVYVAMTTTHAQKLDMGEDEFSEQHAHAVP